MKTKTIDWGTFLIGVTIGMIVITIFYLLVY